MLTAFGPIGRWKLAGGTENDPVAPEAPRSRRYYIDNTYQRFRHHGWLLTILRGF